MDKALGGVNSQKRGNGAYVAQVVIGPEQILVTCADMVTWGSSITPRFLTLSAGIMTAVPMGTSRTGPASQSRTA